MIEYKNATVDLLLGSWTGLKADHWGMTWKDLSPYFLSSLSIFPDSHDMSSFFSTVPLYCAMLSWNQLTMA